MQALTFGPPVAQVYNPLKYAWPVHEQYLRKFGHSSKRVLLLGMNPGPFGMAQTGVPFGEVRAVREWMGLTAAISKPDLEHPKRPVQGFDCPRSEVSGRRLWGLFEQRFGKASDFFAEHFVANYCPLLFLETSGCNRTPDKLSAAEQRALVDACDAHLKRMIEILEPEWLVGVGRFAEECARRVVPPGRVKVSSILHPSPASPASNRNWEGVVTLKLEELGVWPRRTA